MPPDYTHPFEAPLQPEVCDDVQLRTAIRELVHCSAGIDRTGCVVESLLP